MSAPVANRGQYSHLFGSNALPVLEEVFWSTYEQQPMELDKLFKHVSSDRDIWQATEMHDMDLFSQVAEGSEYTFKRPKQGASKTLTVLKYGLGASISKEMMEDGKFDFMADIMRKLGRSAKESKEISRANIFNNGFGSSVLSADGQYLFDSDHTLPSGGTYRNIPSTNADLSPASLEQGLIDFETQFVGDSGIIEYIRPSVLLVPPQLKRYAKELVGSELKPDSNDNNMNSLKGDGLVVVSSPHLTDTDAWFLLAKPEDTGLRVVDRKALSMESDSNGGFATDSIRVKASYREVVGATIAKGVYGCQGA